MKKDTVHRLLANAVLKHVTLNQAITVVENTGKVVECVLKSARQTLNCHSEAL